MSRITRFLCYFLSLKLASVLSYYAFPSLRNTFDIWFGHLERCVKKLLANADLLGWYWRVSQEQKWPFLLIFHLDLHQITLVSFQQLICANLNPTSSGPLRLATLRDGRSDLGDIFRECKRAKVKIMVDHGSSWIIWLMLLDWAGLQETWSDQIFAKLYH